MCLEKYILCYFLSEDRWYLLGDNLILNLILNLKDFELFFCYGKLYILKFIGFLYLGLLCYDFLFDSWMK